MWLSSYVYKPRNPPGGTCETFAGLLWRPKLAISQSLAFLTQFIRQLLSVLITWNDHHRPLHPGSCLTFPKGLTPCYKQACFWARCNLQDHFALQKGIHFQCAHGLALGSHGKYSRRGLCASGTYSAAEWLSFPRFALAMCLFIPTLQAKSCDDRALT